MGGRRKLASIFLPALPQEPGEELAVQEGLVVAAVPVLVQVCGAGRSGIARVLQRRLGAAVRPSRQDGRDGLVVVLDRVDDVGGPVEEPRGVVLEAGRPRDVQDAPAHQYRGCEGRVALHRVGREVQCADGTGTVPGNVHAVWIHVFPANLLDKGHEREPVPQGHPRTLRRRGQVRRYDHDLAWAAVVPPSLRGEGLQAPLVLAGGLPVEVQDGRPLAAAAPGGAVHVEVQRGAARVLEVPRGHPKGLEDELTRVLGLHLEESCRQVLRGLDLGLGLQLRAGPRTGQHPPFPRGDLLEERQVLGHRAVHPPRRLLRHHQRRRRGPALVVGQLQQPREVRLPEGRPARRGRGTARRPPAERGPGPLQDGDGPPVGARRLDGHVRDPAGVPPRLHPLGAAPAHDDAHHHRALRHHLDHDGVS
mmetsp:Transcript_35848/g.100853  ORF Transcript_35848/g.100853 Transcript_35848/m.100853 type:complete len:420 (-) Transcript_35848:2507-3766(-)